MAKGEKNFYANRRRISDLLSSEQPFETAKKMPSPTPTPTPSPSPSLSQLKMPSPSRSVSLDVCLRLDETIFMCLSIPYFSTILGRLSSSSSKHKHRHHHQNLDDETPRRLDRNYDILANRFPVLLPDVKGPFPLPRTTTPLFSSAVVGHTIYILGGDPRDIQGIDDIDHECHNIYPFSQPVLPNPPRPPPPIINQLHNNIDLENNPWPDVKAPETETTTLTETTTWTMPDSPTSTKDTVPESPKTMPDRPTSSKDTVSAESPPDSLTTVPESPPDSPTSSKDTVPESPKTMPDSPTSSKDTVSESPKEEEEEEEIKGICHKIWTFDLHNPWLGWSAGKSLISPRFYPILVPYQGKLYAFGGNHPSLTFAEVYDPISATWTELPPAPFRRLAAPQMYVVPLNGWNKLWVFGTHRSVDYTYDVLTRKWQKCRGARDIIPLFIDHQKLTSACTSKNHMIVYWMNESVAVYAYNLSTNQLFEGTLSGVDYEEGLVDTPLALHHLRDDLFCVIGCSYYLDPIRTVLHVSFLQISIKPLPGSSKPSMLSKAPSKIHKTPTNPLTAAVLACFAYPLKGDIDFNHSYLMSKIK